MVGVSQCRAAKHGRSAFAALCVQRGVWNGEVLGDTPLSRLRLCLLLHHVKPGSCTRARKRELRSLQSCLQRHL